NELLDSPDLLVVTAIVVARIEAVLVAAVGIHVGLGHQMDLGDKARWRLAGKGSVELVDDLPAMHDRRLRNSRDLILAVADALVGRLAAVTGSDQKRRMVRRDACRFQRRNSEVEIHLVE